MKDQTVISSPAVSPIEEAAKQAISIVTARKAELKEKKELLEGEFMQNSSYATLSKTLSEMQKEKKLKEKEMLKSPKLASLAIEIKELSTGVKEKQLALFDYLLDYTERTGREEIVDNTGVTHKITKSAKIKI